MTQLSEALQNPGRFCGLHFCHPVSERPLVEVIHTDATTSETLRRATAFATSLRIAPIVIRDSPGFLLNRLLGSVSERIARTSAGRCRRSVTGSCGCRLWNATRPLASFDEFGIDVAIAVGRSLYRAFPERIVPSELLIAMYKSGRLGRKSGSGFYRTQQDATAGRVDPHVLDMIRERLRTDNRPSDEEIRQRLFLPMLLEATRVLQESLVNSSLVIDTALRNGLGMHGPNCGMFAWADRIGARTLIDWLQPLQKLGQRFEATELLLDAAMRKLTSVTVPELPHSSGLLKWRRGTGFCRPQWQQTTEDHNANQRQRQNHGGGNQAFTTTDRQRKFHEASKALREQLPTDDDVPPHREDLHQNQQRCDAAQ